MGNARGKQAEVRQIGADALSDVEQARLQRRRQRVTRRVRLARQQLAKASSDLVSGDQAGARWYCLTIAGGKEFSVEKLLADANVQVLLPREKTAWVKRGKLIEGERLMFPGYLLVRIVPSAEAFEGLRMQERHGVTGFVSGPMGYHVIADKEMARWWRLSAEEIRAMKVDRTIAQGDRARIMGGLFAGVRCVVLNVKTRSEPSARVLVEADGAALPIDNLPLAFLEKL